jgi:transcriptional regulator with XRE-family HTH domain
VGRWVGHITERRREVRKVKARIRSRAGWSQEELAEFVEVSQSRISEWLSEMGNGTFPIPSEDLLHEASEDLPDEFDEVIVYNEDLSGRIGRTKGPNGSIVRE